MDTEKLMTPEELDSLVTLVWGRAQVDILKQVEYAIATEMSMRARSRAHTLIIREIDAILKPKIEAMKATMVERATMVAAQILPKLEEAMTVSLTDAVKDIDDYTVHQVLAQAERHIREAMLKALEPEKAPPA